LEHPYTTMILAVQHADVIIVDPTHYAVAIKFDENTDEAPIVIAKGINTTATDIQQLARENNVHSMISPQLAQSLYAQTETIGSLIPKEHYIAVAEILAYVYKLAKEQTP
jgi:flagellar biosynthetic protein FlhB